MWRAASINSEVCKAIVFSLFCLAWAMHMIKSPFKTSSLQTRTRGVYLIMLANVLQAGIIFWLLSSSAFKQPCAKNCALLLVPVLFCFSFVCFSVSRCTFGSFSSFKKETEKRSNKNDTCYYSKNISTHYNEISKRWMSVCF